jgi:hypothetical protein
MHSFFGGIFMTGYERCLAVIKGGIPDRVPAYTPTIASDVAGRILGRTVHTGGPALWYAEAAAWCAGPAAWQAFDCQVMEDIIDLHRALAQDVIRFPWRKNIRPTAWVDDTTFVCGAPNGDHQIWRWDEQSMIFFPVSQQAAPRVEDWPEMARQAEKDVQKRIAHASETAGECEGDDEGEG